VAIVVAWLVSLPLWTDTKAWQSLSTPSQVSSRCCSWRCWKTPGAAALSPRRRKLNVIAEALAALMASRALEDDALEEAVTGLREAVGLEERH
jgi:hypothetical protein